MAEKSSGGGGCGCLSLLVLAAIIGGAVGFWQYSQGRCVYNSWLWELR